MEAVEGSGKQLLRDHKRITNGSQLGDHLKSADEGGRNIDVLPCHSLSRQVQSVWTASESEFQLPSGRLSELPMQAMDHRPGQSDSARL